MTQQEQLLKSAWATYGTKEEPMGSNMTPFHKEYGWLRLLARLFPA